MKQLERVAKILSCSVVPLTTFRQSSFFSCTFSIILAGCSTAGSLEATAPASISKLNEDFGLLVREGELPLILAPEEEESASRFAVYPRGRSPLYLIVLHPSKLDGTLTLDVKVNEEVIESAAEYNSYIDRLLAAHRLILKHKILEARTILDSLDAKHQPTHGTLVLRAALEFSEGKDSAALEHLDLARLLFDDRKQSEVGSNQNGRSR